ncbi:MAG: single-stranded-DNA-specific exonuclease RecJ [Deltaproteobacteria bacterium]|nr:single-stranded-DNA-specific exonuclease RecJ [Deltaproteobacteria bacterium]
MISPKPTVLLEPTPEAAFDIEHKLGINPTVARILAVRGYLADDTLLDFLQPRLKNIALPDKLPDLDIAMERIIGEIVSGRTIGIFGDYDVDGIGSASIWHKFFKALRIPDHTIISRRERGYGLTIKDVDEFLSNGVTFIIAIDVGSTDYEAIDHAVKNSVDVVIVDHHHLTPPYPRAVAIVNPLRHDSDFSYTSMASVGLSFYLVAALRSKLLTDGYFSEHELPDVKKYLDIVSLGTLADVAPLNGINRKLTSFGLNLIRNKMNPAIKALADASGIDFLEKISEKSIIFKLVPKLNAPGRMGDAHISFELLTTHNYSKALKIAKRLEEINVSRQKLQEKMLREATMQATASLDYRWPVVVSGEDWHPGIVGIVAAKLAEQFKRPAAAVALINGDTGRGSVRSYGGANIYAALDQLKDLLISFGGHEGAAGIEIKRSKIGSFATEMDRILKPTDTDKDILLKVDTEASFIEITPEFLDQMELLAPFGNSNPEIILYTKKLEVLSVRYPKSVHLSLLLRDPVSRIVHRAIGFNMAESFSQVSQFVNAVYVPERDFFRGGKSIQLRLLHIWSDN